MRARLVIGGAAVLAALVPASVSAVPPTAFGSCPAGPSGWESMSPAEAADATWDDLVGSPFVNKGEYQAAIKGYDVNDDDLVCLATRAQKNARAHWVYNPFFIYKDNNTGAG